MKEPLERFVICKKCSRGAQLYHNPGGGCIKYSAGAPAKIFVGSPDLTNFYGWVISKCKNKKCKNYAKPVPLSEHDFESLLPLCCPECKQEMAPYRDNRGKGYYRYKCKNCQEDMLLADLLPNLAD